MEKIKRLKRIRLIFIGIILFHIIPGLIAQQPKPFTPEDVLKLKGTYDAQISPNGQWIAYTVSIPRQSEEDPGGSYSELHVASVKTGIIRPFITGKINVSSIEWSPDGSLISFRSRRGEDSKTQVWAIPIDGGEAKQLTYSENGVIAYQWHPDGKQIAFTATGPESKRDKALQKKGYGFVYYEENLKHRNLYIQNIEGDDPQAEQLTDGLTVWSLIFSPDGNTIAAAVSPKNLIDHSYMFRKIYLLDIESKSMTPLSDNPGKLGNFAFSPDGSKLVYCAAIERKDHAVSQVYVIGRNGRNLRNLTPPDFKGHVNWAGWKNSNTVIFRAGEGVWPTLSLVPASGGQRRVILDAKKSGIIFGAPDCTADFKHIVFTGSAPDNPGDVYYWDGKGALKKMTDLNPRVSERTLGKQVVYHYKARDGQEIEGILILPVGYQEGVKYPLVMIIHGGPESHYSNRWMTGYSSPGQVLAGRGYAVFYPNYRASTGYGLDFALAGYEDPAGVEFDDIADGIDALVGAGIADPERVGLGGGSYGGYAAAWFSSYYTEKVKGVCMFVGISDLISKRGTTDIPYEEWYVHSGKPLEEMWDLELKRSPVYWAHQSKTAVLIYGGTNDTRVHPSQSIEYYRRLKMNNHPAVRLIQYPGEGHGNRRQPGRIDVLYRTLDWYDWYVMDNNPLDGPMPPLDISDKYGLDLPE